MITLRNNNGEIIQKEYVGTKGDGTINLQTDGTINLQTKGRNTSGNYTANTRGGYTTNTENVEKWFVRVPSGYGSPYCYELTFVGSILKEIGPIVDCR